MSEAKKKTPTWIWVLLVVAGLPLVCCTGLAVLGAAVTADEQAKPVKEQRTKKIVAKQAPVQEKTLSNRVKPKQPAEPEGSFGSGTMIVGKDIQPGRYKSSGAIQGMCYFSRLKGFSGETDDIISNELVKPSDGAAIVSIEKTDTGFQSRGCGRWNPLPE